MPSLPPLSLANTFEYIIHMRNSAVHETTWRNTYSVHRTTAPTPADTIENAFAAVHQTLLLNFAEVFAVEVRNWTQGPVPFSNRPALYVNEFTTPLIGTRNTDFPPGAGAEALGAEVAARVKRTLTTRHKPSNLFIRYAVTNNDVDAAPDGGYIFQSGAPLDALHISSALNTHLSAFLGAGADPGIVVVGVGNHHAGPPFTNPVSTFVCDSVRVEKYHHRSHR